MARTSPTAIIALLLTLSLSLPGASLVSAGEGGASETRTVDGYITFAEVEAKLHSLATNYSDIAVLYDLGELYPNGDGSTKTSWEGNHLWAMKVSDNPAVEEDEPKVLYVGTHHAREWMTPEVMVYGLERVLTQYATNATIRELVDTREMWFWPVLNPDGLIYSQTTDNMWRKNRRDNGDGTFGVDPNRNYGFAWGYDNTGSSGQTDNVLYRGPAPFSEPETQVMRDLALDVGFAGAISFHTYSEVIIFPYAYRDEHAPHYVLMKELSRRMATHNGYEYGDARDGILYNSNGEWSDWMYHNTSCLSFTIEMNPAAEGFQPPSSLIVPTVERNFETFIEVARFADDYYRMFESGISGRVVDPRESPQENASVHVKLLGDDTLDFVTGPDGRFSFIAPSGLFYTIQVEKEGYSSAAESLQALWPDRLTEVNITIKDNVAPVIARVEASHDGEVGTSFGIGQVVRIDLFEASDEEGLEGVVTVQSVPGQYFHRRKSLTWDGDSRSYYYIWDTSDLKPRSDYLVTTELWDIDDNKDKDGVKAGEPDLTLELRDITPPMVPQNLTVSAPPEGGSLTVSWEVNDDDTQMYTLQRQRLPDGAWNDLINLTRSDASFHDQGLTNMVSYSYRLMAWDAVPLPSGWSEVVTGTPRDVVPPGPVTGLKATAPLTGGALLLSWTDSTDDTAFYVVHMDEGSGYSEVARVPRGTTELTVPDLVNKRTYSFKISALDGSGNEGPISSQVLGLPLDQTPPQPPQVDPLPELTNQVNHTVSGTAEANASVLVVVGREVRSTIPVGPDGTFSGTVTLSTGINRIQFRTLDPSENPSALTPEVIVQVDTKAPEVLSSQPLPGQTHIRVNQAVLVVVSEALVRVTAKGDLQHAGSGEEVQVIVEYSEVSKTFTITPSTSLERGTTYRVMVEGMDAAGNALEGGTFEFTTVPEEVKGPVLSTSSLVLLVLLLAVGLAIAGVLLMRRRRALAGPTTTTPVPPEVPPSTVVEVPDRDEPYDPSPQDDSGTYSGRDWEEY